MLPLVIVGAAIGVMINEILTEIIMNLIFTLVLAFIFVTLMRKFILARRAETAEFKAAAAPPFVAAVP
jgi:ABC-type uncharacterized transport system permease subunit